MAAQWYLGKTLEKKMCNSFTLFWVKINSINFQHKGSSKNSKISLLPGRNNQSNLNGMPINKEISSVVKNDLAMTV